MGLVAARSRRARDLGVAARGEALRGARTSYCVVLVRLVPAGSGLDVVRLHPRVRPRAPALRRVPCTRRCCHPGRARRPLALARTAECLHGRRGVALLLPVRGCAARVAPPRSGRWAVRRHRPNRRAGAAHLRHGADRDEPAQSAPAAGYPFVPDPYAARPAARAARADPRSHRDRLRRSRWFRHGPDRVDRHHAGRGTAGYACGHHPATVRPRPGARGEPDVLGRHRPRGVAGECHKREAVVLEQGTPGGRGGGSAHWRAVPRRHHRARRQPGTFPERPDRRVARRIRREPLREEATGAVRRVHADAFVPAGTRRAHAASTP